MIELETERLRFRQWEKTDFEIFSGFYAKEETAQFVGGVKTPEEAYRLMAAYIGHHALHGFSYPAIIEKTSNQLVGTVGLWDSEPWPEPELGYWLRPEFHGKGYGTEAGLEIKAYASETARLPSLVSHIDPTNEPSKQLALRLGATYDTTIDLLGFGKHDVYRYW